MMSDQVLAAGTAVLFLGMPGLFAFVIRYLFLSPWRSTAAGRAIMWLTQSLCALYALGALTAVLGSDWWLRPWLRLAVFMGVTTSIYVLLWALVKIQRADRHADPGPIFPPHEVENDGRR